MIKGMKKQLDEFQKEQNTLDADYKAGNRKILDGLASLLKDAMDKEGITELMLFQFDANGEQITEEDDEYSKEDAVDFDFEELQFGPTFEVGFKHKALVVLTRFVIKNGELGFHLTPVDIHEDGDLTYGGFDTDKIRDNWASVSKLDVEFRKVQDLIIKCLSPESDGIWHFSKAHPESWYLTK